MKKHFLKFGVIAVLTVFVLTACQFFGGRQKLFTLGGVFLESFVPVDAWFVFEYLPTSARDAPLSAQEDLFREKKKLVLGERDKDAFDFLLKPFLQNPLRTLVRDMLVRDAPMILAISPQRDGGSNYQLSFAFSNTEAIEKTIADSPVTNPLDSPVSITRDGSIINFEQGNPQMYGRYDGKFFHLGSSATLPMFLAAAQQQSFLENKQFKAIQKKMDKERSGYAYLLPSAVPPQFAGAFSSLGGNKVYPADAPILFNFSAEIDGIRATSFAKIPKKFDASIRNLFKPQNVELDKRIPGENIALYSEASHFGDVLKLQLAAFPNIEKQLGLSLEKDIYPFLNKNFSVLIEDQGKILPAVSLWVDAEEHLDGAKKLLKQIDGSLAAITAYLNVSNEAENKTKEPMFEKKKVVWNGAEITRATFYPSRYPQETAPFPLFSYLDETWDFTYGISKDGLLFFTTRGDFPNPVIEDDAFYKELEGKITGFDKTERSFAASPPIIRYIERIIELGRKSAKLSADELSTLETAKQILVPLQGIISGNREKNGWIESQTFVKIE